MSGLTLTITILADAVKAKRALNDTGDDLDKLASRGKSSSSSFTSSLGKMAAGAVSVAVVGDAIKDAWQAAEEAAKIARETARVIETTGAAAWISARQVADLAGAISDKTGVDDEAIQSGENLLLTFTNIKNEVGEGNDIFTQATGLALDMSTALGTDLSGASIQLGKALNDPTKGLTALSKAGVSFTADQKLQIQTMQASGDLLGAQKIILGELAKEFGGAAEAAATPLDKLKVKVGNVQEAIGAALIPVVAGAADLLVNDFGPGVDRVTAFLGENSEAVKFLASVGFAGLAAAVAPVVWEFATLAATGVVDALFAVGAAAYVLTTDFLATAAAEGVLAAATGLLEATMLPVVIGVAAVGAALYMLVSAMNTSSDSADAFFEAANKGVDVSSWDQLVASSEKTDAEIRRLKAGVEEGAGSFGNFAASMADTIIPFTDVENSTHDQNNALDTLSKKQMEATKFTKENGLALVAFAENTTRANMATETMPASLDNLIGTQKRAAVATSAMVEQLHLIAQQEKIDLTKEGAAARVQALYEKTLISSPAVLQLTDAQEKYNEAAATAKDKVNAYKSALDGLFGISLSAAEMETKLSEMSFKTAEALGKTEGAAKGLTDVTQAGSLVQVAAVNTANGAIQSQVKTIEDAAKVRYEQVAGIYGEQAALEQASLSLKGNRDQLILTMTQHGYSKEAAENYIDQLGLTPDHINTLVNLDAEKSKQDLFAVGVGLDRANKGAYGVVSIEAQSAFDTLFRLGVKLTDIERQVISGNVNYGGGIGSRMAGGPVSGGSAYIVGERGPELFVADRSGFIWPNAGSAPGGNVYNVSVVTSGLGADNPAVERSVVAAIRNYERRNGPLYPTSSRTSSTSTGGGTAAAGYAGSLGDGINTTFTVPHMLGTADVVVEVYLADTGETVLTDVYRPTENTIEVTFATAPAINEMRCTVLPVGVLV
jgi:hypothetical protein